MRQANILVIETGNEASDFLAVAFPERSWILSAVRELDELRNSLADSGTLCVVAWWLPRFWPLIEWLVERRPGVPLILLANDWPGLLPMSLADLGVFSCLRWPRDRELLVETVQRCVTSRQSPVPIELV
jgi:DNA-binding NtrC family response regulator